MMGILLTQLPISFRYYGLSGGVAQVVEHTAHIRSVRGSKPCTAKLLTHQGDSSLVARHVDPTVTLLGNARGVNTTDRGISALSQFKYLYDRNLVLRRESC